MRRLLPEQETWRQLRPLMLHLDPHRIESHMHGGVPDVNYVAGWVELKQIADWPKRASTPVSHKRFEEEQRGWLTRRCAAGGRAFLMLHVRAPMQWLLFNGAVAAQVIGGPGVTGLCREGLAERAIAIWSPLPKRDHLTRLLCG